MWKNNTINTAHCLESRQISSSCCCKIVQFQQARECGAEKCRIMLNWSFSLTCCQGFTGLRNCLHWQNTQKHRWWELNRSQYQHTSQNSTISSVFCDEIHLFQSEEPGRLILEYDYNKINCNRPVRRQHRSQRTNRHICTRGWTVGIRLLLRHLSCYRRSCGIGIRPSGTCGRSRQGSTAAVLTRDSRISHLWSSPLCRLLRRGWLDCLD